MFAYIGRQAIYGKELVVSAYELLYRNGGGGNSVKILDGDAATRSVLTDAVNVFGISQLTDGLPAFINFTRNLIMEDFAYMASPKEIVVEVPGNITIDEPFVRKLSDLRRSGYQLSLDSYNEMNGALRFNDILPMFDVIRVNVGAFSRLQLTNMVRRLRQSRARLLAERIETEEQFDLALNLDFAMFQGYYFEKPSRLSKQLPPLSQSAQGRLLNELLLPNIDFDYCVHIVRENSLLSYLFMRESTTSAVLMQQDPEKYIKRGMVRMGTDELLRWVCLTLLMQSNVTNTDEMSRRAYRRGRFIELLMENSETQLHPGKGFLLGLFSLLDKVMNVRMETLLSEMNLDREIKDALLGREENEYSLFLQYVVIYEIANPRLILPDIHLKIEEKDVSMLYMTSIANTDAAFDPVRQPSAIYRGTILRNGPYA